MRKLEIADAEIMQLAIRQEIERSEESRYDHRLHGVLLVSNGYSCTEVGQLLGQAATTVQRWVRRFEQSGFDGLREGERPGRPRALDESQWPRIEADLRATSDLKRACGMDQSCPNICASDTGSSWAFASARDCSDRWVFGCASRARRWRSLILSALRR
jgi:hypothetical protein